jgi:hypothetical protein
MQERGDGMTNKRNGKAVKEKKVGDGDIKRNKDHFASCLWQIIY